MDVCNNVHDDGKGDGDGVNGGSKGGSERRDRIRQVAWLPTFMVR